MCVLGICELPGTANDGGPDGPIEDAPIDSPDADVSCSCTGNTLACGGQPSVDCLEGCNPDPMGARCYHVAPSNGLMYTPATTVDVDVVVNEDLFVNTDTGEIDGTIFHRDAGEGEIAGIVFSQETYMGAPLGVFWLKSLTVKSGKTITAGGDRSLVVIASSSISVEQGGKIDVSAGCNAMNACAGPGGGDGAHENNAALGCGPGGDGDTDASNNSGGGGGGGGTKGGGGGTGGVATPGTAGPACMNGVLEPLTGGSGGGRGGITTAMAPPLQAGGGGGGIQLTSNVSIEIRGTIDASGQGGEAGVVSGLLAGGGNGGGAGGGILLEAPSVSTLGSARIGANGGGGGAGAAIGLQNAGQKGRLDTVAATGGAATLPTTGAGGAGGAKNVTAMPGASLSEAGGGGGAVGVIVVRAFPQSRSVAGQVSPAANVLDLRTR
jgi:hypothetical protein